MPQSTHGLCDRAESRLIPIGAILTKTRDTQHDEAAIDGEELRPAETPGLKSARLEVLDEHVSIGNERPHDVLTLRIAKIQGNRALVARLNLPPDRGAVLQESPLAQWIAEPGRLNLDDIGAKIRQGLSAERAGDQLSDLDDPHTGQYKGCLPAHGIALSRRFSCCQRRPWRFMNWGYSSIKRSLLIRPVRIKNSNTKSTAFNSSTLRPKFSYQLKLFSLASNSLLLAGSRDRLNSTKPAFKSPR